MIKIIKKTEEKGITMITLVVTIIVMMILVGISTSLLLGDNGVINQVKKHKERQEIIQISDKLELCRVKVASQNDNKVPIDKYIEYIEDKQNFEYSVDYSKKPYIKINEKYLFLLQQDGNYLKIVYIENGESIPENIISGTIVFSDTIWDEQTNKASITINKINVEDSLQIQYQINGCKEESWINGSTVTGLNVNDKVYARLWDGTNGGTYITTNIEDKTKPTLTINISNTTTYSITVDVQATDKESGISDNVIYSYYIKKQNDEKYSSTANARIASSTYTFTGLPTETSYDIKVETNDRAGNLAVATIKTTIYEIPYDKTDIWQISDSGLLSLKYGTIESSILKDTNGNPITKIIIPNNVNETTAAGITNHVFYNCSNLTSVIIPDSITSIGDAAFQFCSNLSNVDFGNNMTTICNSAFHSCTSLTDISLNAVSTIDYYAFYGCTNLTNVTLSNNITYIGDCAFSNCPKLANITIPNTITFIGVAALNNCQTITIKGYTQAEFEEAVSTGKITLGANWKSDSATLIFEK